MGRHVLEVRERPFGEAHCRYTRYVNFRQRWRGHLWQARFGSFVMDEAYLLAAARYVEHNPVRARRGQSAGQYRWSSARAHLQSANDVVVKDSALLHLVPDWRALLKLGAGETDLALLRRHERTGRPLGDDGFLKLRRLKPGPKPQQKRN